MKANKIIAVAFIIVMMFTLVACSSNSKLVGQWVEVEGNGVADSFILREDGSASIEGWSGEWIIDDGKLYISNVLDGGEYYNYDISGNKLTLIEVDDPDDVSIYKKVS